MSLDERSQKLGEMLAEVRNSFQGATQAIDETLKIAPIILAPIAPAGAIIQEDSKSAS